ncbi:MAG TPA: hypothetical protein VNV82_08695 [Bryobacteraceae bacterium]|jgi:hypothetical protein|nr:hypothetical protein [Bryobacteraceae bacterium]
MASKIVARIAAEIGIPRLFSALSEDIALSDLQSLLMHVYQSRTAESTESDLRRSAERGLVASSKVDARTLNQFDRTAFQIADEFDAIELAPVGPLGLNHVLGGIDQNNVLTTIRNAEVLGDPTTALALECWRRRKGQTRAGGEAVRLCCSQRLVRLQPFDEPGYAPHFRLFALVTSGRDTGSHSFEIQHLGEHIRFYLRLFAALNEQGFSFREPLVEISDTLVVEVLLRESRIDLGELRSAVRAHVLGGSERFLSERGVRLPEAIEDPARELPDGSSSFRLARLKTELIDKLRHEFPDARFRFNLARLEGLSYYQGVCLRISPMAPDGNRYPITDGGLTDWTARLLEDRKERLLATGIGSEFACVKFRS